MKEQEIVKARKHLRMCLKAKIRNLIFKNLIRVPKASLTYKLIKIESKATNEMPKNSIRRAFESLKRLRIQNKEETQMRADCKARERNLLQSSRHFTHKQSRKHLRITAQRGNRRCQRARALQRLRIWNRDKTVDAGERKLANL